MLPDLKTGEVKSVQQLCGDYVSDPHRIKELQLTKVLDWDTALVQRGEVYFMIRGNAII